MRQSARNAFAMVVLSLCGAIGAGFTVQVNAAEDTGRVSYTLTRQYGSVLFRVMQQEYLTLVGRFDDYAATLEMDFEDIGNSRLTASVQMGSLNMPDADIVETLINSSIWFNAPLYPQATFTTTAVEVTGENSADFVGELTFLGATRPWTLHVTFFGGSDGVLTGSTIGMQATGSFDRTDFGMDQYLNMAAAEVTIEVNVKFNRN